MVSDGFSHGLKANRLFEKRFSIFSHGLKANYTTVNQFSVLKSYSERHIAAEALWQTKVFSQSRQQTPAFQPWWGHELYVSRLAAFCQLAPTTLQGKFSRRLAPRQGFPTPRIRFLCIFHYAQGSDEEPAPATPTKAPQPHRHDAPNPKHNIVATAKPSKHEPARQKNPTTEPHTTATTTLPSNTSHSM